MNLFNAEINSWESWSKIFNSIKEFEPLIQHIFKIENLSDIKQISLLKPGTNAVFKIDDKVIKIFVPEEAGYYPDVEFSIEAYGLQFADKQGIPVPKLITSGVINDKYKFRYMIMDYIKGKVFDDIECEFTDEDKFKIGKHFAEIKIKLNIPCDKFCDINIIERSLTNERWNKFPQSFNDERIRFLEGYKLQENVFVHGDINPDNVIFGDDGVMYLIDFADTCIAPSLYELAPLICEVFNFEKPYLDGYGELCADDLFDSLLLHDFGGDIIKNNFGEYDIFKSLDILRKRIEVMMCRRL